MRKDMRKDMHTDMSGMCADLRTDMCLDDMRTDMHTDISGLCVDMCVDMCVDVCLDMCVNMCADNHRSCAVHRWNIPIETVVACLLTQHISHNISYGNISVITLAMVTYQSYY